jgi:hypothetical protein
LALAGALLGAAGSAGGSGAPAPARAGAVRLLEQRSVPATGRVVQSRTKLKKGRRYRLVMTGTVSTVVGSVSGTIGSRFDALYCYETFGTSPLANDPSSSCTTHVRRHGSFVLGQRALGFPEQLNPRGTDTTYNPRHRYAVSFRAKRTAKLRFVFRTNVRDRSGHYTVRLYGAGAAPKKPPPPRRCPAPHAGSASRAHAAAACHWVVNFTFSQTGPPSKSHPAPRPGFVTSETHGLGKVFFNAKPKPGRTSSGSAAGQVIHVDTYQSPVNPFQFDEGELALKPVSAKYTRRRDGTDLLAVKVEVTGVKGVAYSDDESDRIKPKDTGAIALRADRADPVLDFMVLSVQCGSCAQPDVGTRGDHTHEYQVGSRDKLRVEIGRPHSL